MTKSEFTTNNKNNLKATELEIEGTEASFNI